MPARPCSGLVAVQAPTLAPGQGGRVMEFAGRQGGSQCSEGVGGNIAALSMDLALSSGACVDELRAEWRRLYRSEAPRFSRDLLVRGIGYRRQEIEHGGLAKSTLRKLQTIAKALRSTGRVGPTPSLSLKPGGTACARMARSYAHCYRD